MENARIKIYSGRRIYVDCLLELESSDRKTPLELSFKFDTGAQNTCISARKLHITETEKDFVKKYKPRWRYEGTGIDDKSTIYFYPVMVKRFDVLGVSLGRVPIYITFDERFSKRLLGLDLLNLLNYSVDNDKRLLYIAQTNRLKSHIESDTPITTEEMIRMGLYDPTFDLDYMKSL